jgi:hypothetical protein
MKVLPCALLLLSSVLSAAQDKKGMWQRVYTGEDSIIEIDTSKVTFVEYSTAKKVTFTYGTGRARFRTIYSRPEVLKETGVKFKSRLETLEFNCAPNTARYRLYEATLLDEKGKVIRTFGWDPAAEWKEAKHGGMMEKLSGAACALIDEKRRNQ